jgi:target of rapamycin complex 2 subunit MAPKAP1/AVO1
MPATPTRAPGDLDATKNSEKDAKRNSGFPGAALKYSQTIVGHNRSGAMGMRVNGKRGSLIREPVAQADNGDTPEAIGGKRHRSDSEPTPAPPSPGALDVDHAQAPQKPMASTLLRRRSADASELETAPTSASYFTTTPVVIATPTPTIEPFKPPFARAAEMEERRRIRMRSRFASGGSQPRPKAMMDPMTGREQRDMESTRERDADEQDENLEEDVESESGSDDDSDLMGGDGDMPLGEDAVEDDFFDPCVGLSRFDASGCRLMCGTPFPQAARASLARVSRWHRLRPTGCSPPPTPYPPRPTPLAQAQGLTACPPTSKSALYHEHGSAPSTSCIRASISSTPQTRRLTGSHRLRCAVKTLKRT